MSSDEQPLTRAQLRRARLAADQPAEDAISAPGSPQSPGEPGMPEAREQRAAPTPSAQPPREAIFRPPPPPLSEPAEPSAGGSADPGGIGYPPIGGPGSEPETEAAETASRRRWPFGVLLAAIVGVLILVGSIGTAVVAFQGPRISQASVDPIGVADASGQRLVLTLNQPVNTIQADDVSISPEVPFTVDSSGRTVGVQFTHPLDIDTEYAVTIAGVQGVSGGSVSELSYDFRTGTPPLYLLQRNADGDDSAFVMNLLGDQAVPVMQHAQIEDVRGDRQGAVVAVASDTSAVQVFIVNGEGEPSPLAMPGTGMVGQLQLADRGGLLGFVYTDADITENSGIEARLFLANRNRPDDDPVEINFGPESRVAEWTFVPGTTSLLALTFDGILKLVDTVNTDVDPVQFGTASTIYGVEPGTGRVLIERVAGTFVLDLTDGTEEQLSEPEELAAYGQPGPVVPLGDGATLRLHTLMGEQGFPQSQDILRVDADGTVTEVFHNPDSRSAILQACASPSGQYVAATVAPDLASNPYDHYLRPLPQRLETHIVEVATGEPITVVSGSGISWCRVSR